MQKKNKIVKEPYKEKIMYISLDSSNHKGLELCTNNIRVIFFHPNKIMLTKILKFFSVPGETSAHLLTHFNICLQKSPNSWGKKP
jgi:hypothetical protein